MCREPRHGVDLEEPQAGVIEHQIHTSEVAATEPGEGVHGDLGATLGDVGRNVRVELVSRVVTKVLCVVVVKLNGGHDLDQRQWFVLHDADGQPASSDVLLRHDDVALGV